MGAIDRLLARLFVGGFYHQYSGLFLLVVFLFVGMCPPGQHWNVWVALAFATVSQGWLLAVVVAVFSLYLLLVVQFVRMRFTEEPYRFLRLGLGAQTRFAVGFRWLTILCLNGLPLLFFAATAATAGFLSGKLLLPGLLLLYVMAAFAICVGLTRRFTEPLTWTDRARLTLDIGAPWESSYVLLGLRQVLSTQRVPYLLAKLLSYLFVNGLFFVYTDVRDHTGVVMLVLTAIVMGHSTVLAGQFTFERKNLSLLRNLPHRKLVRFGQVSLRLILLLLPEAVWLLVRYPLADAALFLAYLWTFALFLYHLFFFLPPSGTYGSGLFFLFITLAVSSPWGILNPLIVIFAMVSLAIHTAKA